MVACHSQKGKLRLCERTWGVWDWMCEFGLFLKPQFCFRTHRPGEMGGSGSGPLPLHVSHPSPFLTTWHLHAPGAHESLAWGDGAVVW